MVGAGPSVSVFIGNDVYTKEKAIEDLASSILGSSSRTLDFKVFRAPQTSAREVIDQLSTIPFLAPRRLIVLREFEKLSADDRKRIAEYSKKPVKTACLVIEAKDDSVLGSFSTDRRRINVRVFNELAGQDLAAWIRKFMSERSKRIEPEAIEFLKETCSGDLAYLSHELEKLIAFAGKSDLVRRQDVEALVGDNLVASAFDLTNAIENNRADAALEIVRKLLTNGKKHHEIIGLLTWHVKRLFKAKMLKRKGATDTYIAGIMKINRKYFGKFFKQVTALKMSAIKSQMRVLLETDLDIKRSRLDPALAIECAIIRLCLGCA